MFTKAEYQSLYMTEVPRWHATFQVLLKHKEKVGIYMATAPSWPNLAKGNTGTPPLLLSCGRQTCFDCSIGGLSFPTYRRSLFYFTGIARGFGL